MLKYDYVFFFVQIKKMNQKKTALLVKNNFINFVLKTKIHKLGLCPQTYEFLRFVHCINHKLFFNAGKEVRIFIK